MKSFSLNTSKKPYTANSKQERKHMETVKLSFNPFNIIRQLIQQIYEQNINQYKNDESLELLKYATFDFLFLNNHLSDEFIDKICSTLTDSDELKIDNTNEFRYKLWRALINSDEYISYVNDKRILESGVFDKKYKREYEANFGEHFLAILSALKDANISKENADEYIEENLCIYGKRYKDSNTVKNNFIPLTSNEKIKPIDKKKLVNHYQEKYWIKTTSE